MPLITCLLFIWWLLVFATWWQSTFFVRMVCKNEWKDLLMSSPEMYDDCASWTIYILWYYILFEINSNIVQPTHKKNIVQPINILMTSINMWHARVTESCLKIITVIIFFKKNACVNFTSCLASRSLRTGQTIFNLRLLIFYSNLRAESISHVGIRCIAS